MAGDRLVATDAKKFRSQIRHILGNMHVGTSMAEVEAEMSRRIAKMRKQGADITAAFVRGIKRIAKAEHKKNQQLYHGVMSGSLGRRKNPRKRNPKHPFTVTMRYVVSDDPYAPRSKKDVVAIRDGKEYARWPWHYRSKPRMGSKQVTINGIRFKTSWR